MSLCLSQSLNPKTDRLPDCWTLFYHHTPRIICNANTHLIKKLKYELEPGHVH